MAESGVHVSGVPEDDGIDDQAQSPQLVFLPLAVAPTDFPTLAMERSSRKTVADLSSIQLYQDAATVVFVVNVGKQVERLCDPPEFSDCAGQG